MSISAKFIVGCATAGAVLFDGLLLAGNFAYDKWGHDHWLVGLQMLLVIPAMMISPKANPFIVDALLGAVTFALVAVFGLSMFKNAKKGT